MTEGGEHRLDNGLLLRSDVHTIFDRGYLGVDPKYRLVVSSRLREEFGNGAQFYAEAGQVIGLPARRADQPNREFLEWHLEEAFSRPEAEPTAQLNRAEGIRRALDRRGAMEWNSTCTTTGRHDPWVRVHSHRSGMVLPSCWR